MIPSCVSLHIATLVTSVNSTPRVVVVTKCKCTCKVTDVLVVTRVVNVQMKESQEGTVTAVNCPLLSCSPLLQL